MSAFTGRRNVLALIVLFVAAAARAGSEPWDAPAFTAKAQDVAAAAASTAAGEHDAVVLLDETQYEFDGSGKSVSRHRLVVRIAGESAIEDWATVETRWVPWLEERPSIEARVVAKDGSERRLDPAAIVDTPGADASSDMFTDDRILKAPLPAVAVGSVIEQVVTHRETKPFFDSGTTGIVMFGAYVPTTRIRLTIDAPEQTNIRVANETTPHLEPVRQTSGGRQTLRFEGGPYEPVEHFEWNLPYDTAPFGYVAFSTGTSWQAIASRYAEIVDAQIATTPAGKLPQELLQKRGDPRDTIRRALAYVQTNIRYAGVELGDSSIVPRAPGAVLSTRYGDCKDKATLLVAILRAAGIDAHLALLRSGVGLDIRKDLPGFGRFDHAIVQVGGATPMWIDATADFTPAGELPVGDQGRLALVASTATTDLTLTPVAEGAANLTVETRTFTLPEEGKASVVEVTEASGEMGASLRSYYASSDRKQYRESMEEYAKSHYRATALKNLEAGDPHDLSKPFRLRLDITEAGRGVTDSGEAVVAVFPSGLTAGLPYALQNDPTAAGEQPAEKDRRKNDFVFTPFVKEWRYVIVPPPGYTARPFPPDETIPLGTTTLRQQFTAGPDGSVTATFRFDSGRRRLTPAEFEATRKAIAGISESPAVVIGFEQTAAKLLNQGDIAGALAEYRRLARLHPKEAHHQAEIANALLAGGMGEAAREQIRKAVALEPGYANGWRTQGVILQHDLLGRRLHRGCDLSGAVAAYRKAKELDPKNADIRRELARLLEYGDGGLPFGTNAHAAEAVAEYKALAADLDEQSDTTDYLVALAHTGDFATMKTVAANAKSSNDRAFGTIASVAATDGAAAAVQVARSYDSSERKELLRRSASLMFALRRYDVAVPLIDEANNGSATATTRAQLDVLRKARPFNAATLPANDPASVVKRLIATSLDHGATVRDITACFTADLRPIIEKETPEEQASFFSTRSTLTRVAREQGLPLTFYVDVGISGGQYTADGNDQTGYRIRLRGAAGGGNETYFVVRDGGEYRISAMESVSSMIGWSALRWLDAGKPEAARQWLNWAREELEGGSVEDVLDGSPFASLWQRETQSASPGEIRVAAAALMATPDFADRATPLLIAARDSETSADRRLHIQHALASAYAAKEDFPAALRLGEELQTALPRSGAAFAIRVGALTRLGRWADVEAAANERLRLFPTDSPALRTLVSATMARGDYAAADRICRRVMEQLTPNAFEYNQLAWNALLAGTDLSAAIEDARRGLPATGSGPPALLHTLAALYAEAGKSGDARDALWQSMESRGREEPTGDDWYVLGRIAESCGATDAAAAAYRRMEKPKVPNQASTYVLAQRGLKRLGAK